MSVTYRRVQFAEAGEGYELFFRNSDLRSLYNIYGPSYMQTVEVGLQRHEGNIVDRCLFLALRDRDGQRVIKECNEDGSLKDDDIDRLDVIPHNQLCEKLLDAFSRSNNGRAYEEHLEWIAEQEKKHRDKLNKDFPQKSPGGSLDVYSETPTGPG